MNEGRGSLYFRKDGKYLLYIPLDVAEDSMFPLKTEGRRSVKVSFKIGEKHLTVEEWTE